MDKKIITKFTVVTEEGIDNLLFLTKVLAEEKLSAQLPTALLEQYISEHFNEKKLIEEVNSLSNQWLIVYIDDLPAGYARITANGIRPRPISDKRAVRIADFGVMEIYKDTAALESLLYKCMNVCKSYEAIWLNEYKDNPFLSFFEAQGFKKLEQDAVTDDLAIASVYLLKEN